MKQSESQLQCEFIDLLRHNGYEYIELKDEDDLIKNFKKQLELFNKKRINNFDQILDYLNEGDFNSKFDKLRNSYDDIRFIDFSDVSANIFQVSQEITAKGEYSNRYDVSILINGLPLVQVELKKSGVKLENAFNQIKRYDKHSYSKLFNYIQVFVISNKVHTRYFFNDSNFNYNLTYTWDDNKDLESFTNSFLIKEKLMDFLSKCIFKDLLSNEYKMLRPYQMDALKTVENQIKKNQNAYIWMSYNTGKTLTSLRLAQLLKDNYKVVYLSTNHLSKYPSNFVVKNKNKFIRTLDRKGFVITSIRNVLLLEDIDKISDEKIIFILNEYEKFNEKYDPLNLKNKFKNSLFYCFTSAPIFDENIINDETTKFIFDNKVYSYCLKDALMDKTNLDFDIEYVDDLDFDFEYNFSSKIRIKEISKYILESISKKTLGNKFKSILITSSNEDLLDYYSFLKNSDLKVATVLRYDSNDFHNDKPIMEYLEEFINDYNSNFDADIKYKKVVDSYRISEKWESDILKRFKNDEIDLLVMDESMLNNKYKLNLLGNLKNPQLNTIYLDCNLKYDSLFEALTMANELGDNDKTSAHIITFRDLRKNINDSVKLFSNENASEKYKLKTYDYYLKNYKDALSKISETGDFIKNYNELSSNYYILERFDDFDFNQAQIDEFNDYKDTYEHEKLKLNSSKKIIPKFNLKVVDQYSINLDYVNDLLEGKLDKSAEIDSKDQSDNVNNDILNIKTEINDNSQILNITDSSQSVNINEVNIYIDNPKNEANDDDLSRDKIIETSLVENINDNLIKENNIDTQIDYAGEEIVEYPVKVGEGDLLVNLNNELNKINLSANGEKIISKECPYCGRRYADEANFCMQDPGVELIKSDKFKKVCPECGMKYKKDSNYCSQHAGVKLMDIEDFPKICPKCGRRFRSDANFCSNDAGVKLLTKKDVVKYCPTCGAEYSNDYDYCIRCQSKSQLKDIIKTDIKDIEFSPNDFYNLKSHKNNIDSLSELFSKENLDKLINFTFTQKDYDDILDNIIKTHDAILNKLIKDYEIELDELSALEKVLLSAKAFVKVEYKDSGPDLGRFIFNCIYLDDRKPGVALEITTIIHELSHFLISEILEQIIMEVLDTYKNDVIEGFVCYCLIKDDFNKMIDEFSAHTVEVKYTGFGYQDFSSYTSIYKNALESGNFNEDMNFAPLIGNTFARDIKYIFESFIDNDLRMDIIDEFSNIEDSKDYKNSILEQEKLLSFEDFIAMIKYMLVYEIEDIEESEIERLQNCILEFNKNNN